MIMTSSLNYFYILEGEHDYTLEILSNSEFIENLPKPKNIEKSYLISLEEISNCNFMECPICKEEFKKNMLIAKLDCGHIFCKDCIQYWVENKKSCPYCRANIVYKSERFSDPFIELATMF